ncbi:MAG: ArsC family reductase [Kangiellaceae bacterium]|jgi:Spx/MgsR family transcriptional regulator|nr:ArsC family reductase [Kangiellaceae bacterium]
MKPTIYGIKNCDTMKKAIKWLDENNIDYNFHDYKKQGISAQLAATWIEQIDLDVLINKRGTTWRKLDQASKDNLSKATAVKLIQEHNSMVKRPLLHTSHGYSLGFTPDLYSEIFDQ